MKKVTKLFSLLLCIAMVFGMLPTVAMAATPAGYVWPVDGASMSQGWYQAGNSAGHATHLAIDVTAAYGTTVKAVNSGTVLCASASDASAGSYCPDCKRVGAGYHVAVQHSDGLISHYAHLSAVSVSKGSTVSAGQKIGEMGTTGNSTGTHLHFAIFNGPTNQDSSLINPLMVISPFANVYADGITETSATLHATFGASATNIDQAGFYIGTDPNNLQKYTEVLYSNGIDASGNYITGIFYGTQKWCGTLQPGTTYYYKIWMSAYDNTYVSELKSFQTGGGHTHSWSAWSVTQNAACTAAGTKKRTCSGCGTAETETIAALGHNYSTTMTVDIKATCTTDGSKSYHCTRCDAKSSVTAIQATGHSWSGWTASDDGRLTRSCGSCGTVEFKAAAQAAAILTVAADQADAQVGDIVHYTVSLSPITDLGCAAFKLDIPEGLAYVAGSAQLANGLNETLGMSSTDWTERVLLFSCFGNVTGYNSTEDTLLLTFDCEVTDASAGTEVSLKEVELGDRNSELLPSDVVFQVVDRTHAVSGRVTSFASTRNASGAVTVRLLDENGEEVAATTTTDGTYSIERVAAGTYTVEVSKANHVTRTYELTIEGDVALDVEIWLIGDVNGDGTITIRDSNLLNSYYCTVAELDDYAAACGDLDGNGVVSILEVNRVYLHFRNVASLWS